MIFRNVLRAFFEYGHMLCCFPVVGIKFDRYLSNFPKMPDIIITCKGVVNLLLNLNSSKVAGSEMN
jgi:hypothetical protein